MFAFLCLGGFRPIRIVKREPLSYSDSQIRSGFEALRPEGVKCLEEWLVMNNRDRARHPRMAKSTAGINPPSTNRIGEAIGITRQVDRDKTVQ